MPVPGKCMTPIGMASSIVSLRLNGAAFACFVQSGLKAICGTLRLLAHFAAINSAPSASRRAAEPYQDALREPCRADPRRA